MIDLQQKNQKQQQQLKRFNFFEVQKIVQKIDDPSSHPIKLIDVDVVEVAMIGNKILLSDRSNKILVFTNNIQGSFIPYTGCLLKMTTNDNGQNGLLLTYGEDSDGQGSTSLLKVWKFGEDKIKYDELVPRNIIIGDINKSQRNVSCIHFLPDASLIVLGTRKGQIIQIQSKNILQSNSKPSEKAFDRKDIKCIRAIKKADKIDLYFSTEESFYWLENCSQKRRIIQCEAEIIENSLDNSVFVTFKDNNKTIFQYREGKQIRSINLEGEKKIIQQFGRDYLAISIFERKNEKTDTTQKYRVHIMDMKNQYFAYSDTFARVQSILTSSNKIVIVGGPQKGQRIVQMLTERPNSFKIQTFFKKSFFNQAWKFAKNQNCDQSLLAQISRLNGDLQYSKNDYVGSIKHYILTLGYIQPSYVIRKFLDVSQIDYLIEYLQKIHEKKFAKKEHTALLVNCYVKKQKIKQLNKFLSQSSIESDLFDIQTAIKVCKQNNHFEQALQLAQKKNKHELYLKILIQNKRKYEQALQHIKKKVQMQQKQKYIIQFGQDFMANIPQPTISLIKLMVLVHSISQTVRTRQRDCALSKQEKSVLDQLQFKDQLDKLSIITFKKPDEYFRLFLTNNESLQNFLLFLIKQIPKLPHEQVVFHRLIQFYLQMIKNDPNTKQTNQNKILEILDQQNKRYDNNHLLALFKMYDFDQGVVALCKKLGMRDDLLNFYISKNRDKDILDLCKEHGVEEVDLWMHALKYFIKPQYQKQQQIRNILQSLSQIRNLSPLPILSILSKNKKLQYGCVKSFFLSKLKADKQDIKQDNQTVQKNMRTAEERRVEFKKLKTTAKAFLSNNCVSCNSGLYFPSIHLMCGHSFHEHCLGNDRECIRCGYEMKSILSRKQKYIEGAKDQTKFFEALEQRKSTGFQVVAEFLGKGLFKNKLEK